MERSYQMVMYWGGLRGAIVLSLEGLANADVFIAVVMGTVLFTLLAQGLTIGGLVHRLGVDKPPPGFPAKFPPWFPRMRGDRP